MLRLNMSLSYDFTIQASRVWNWMIKSTQLAALIPHILPLITRLSRWAFETSHELSSLSCTTSLSRYNKRTFFASQVDLRSLSSDENNCTQYVNSNQSESRLLINFLVHYCTHNNSKTDFIIQFPILNWKFSSRTFDWFDIWLWTKWKVEKIIL